MNPKHYNSNIFFAYLVIEELVRNNITQFCISPGSRSSPLTFAAAHNGKAVKNIFYDERAAAFYALGYARSTGKPAVLICTSGTALANYLPAVIEAAQDNISMVVISADRPPELQDTGANQTIHQTNIYGNYAKWQFNFNCPDEKVFPQQVLTTIDQAIYQSINNPRGVVHLNCMFREPLVSEENITIPLSSRFLEWQKKQKKYTNYSNTVQTPTKQDLEMIIAKIKSSQKILLVIGKIDSFVENEKIKKFVDQSGLPVYADTLSNIPSNTLSINHFDSILLEQQHWEKYKPEIIIHLGGQLVSKRYTQFIEAYPPLEYIIIKETPYRYDPCHITTIHIQSDLEYFAEQILAHCPFSICDSWKQFILEKEEKIKTISANLIAKTEEFNEIFIATSVIENTPSSVGLFLANSMTIRYFEMYAKNRSLKIACNRGTSGIDGNLATAIGFAQGLKQAVTIVIGDLSLIHDLNSLSLIQQSAYPIYIVVLNNHSGSIFAHLPIAKYNDIFEKYFLTPHSFHFAKVSENFNIEYHCPSQNQEFSEIYQTAIKNKKSCLIEVITSYKTNLNLQTKLKQQITSQ